jgi:hypothetical protein
MNEPMLKQLMDQHTKVLRMKADMDDINFLYPEDGVAGQAAFRETFLDGARGRLLHEVQKMEALMALADPETLAEARRRAIAERDGVKL